MLLALCDWNSLLTRGSLTFPCNDDITQMGKENDINRVGKAKDIYFLTLNGGSNHHQIHTHRTRHTKNPPYIQTSSWELMTSLLALCFHSHGEIDAGALLFVQLFAWTNCWTNIRVTGGLRRHRSHFHYWNFDRLSYLFRLERWFEYSLPRRRSFTRTMVHTCTVSVCRRTDRRTDKMQPITNILLPPSQEENAIAIATNVFWC